MLEGIFVDTPKVTDVIRSSIMWRDALRRVRIVYAAMTEHGPAQHSISFILSAGSLNGIAVHCDFCITY
jgi:hypothetical protein